MRKVLAATMAAVVAFVCSEPFADPAPAATHAAPAPASLLAPSAAVPPDQLEALVDGAVQLAMRRDHVAGVDVAVVQDGQVVLKKGYGFAGPGRPVDPDATLFRIGSISKTFTWIAAMKEVEAGRMRLDAPINAYLPPEDAVPDAPGWRQVELNDLMSHTPGFEDRSLGHQFIRSPQDTLPLTTELRLHRPRRVFAPGTTPAYSNYGAMLAGAAIQHLEGAPYQDVVEREIIDPLGLSHTTFREPYPARADLPAPMPPALAADVSAGYRWTGTGFAPQPYEWHTSGAPAGAGSTTAADMARYMLMMLADGTLDGVRIYGPATAAAFRTPIPIPEPDGGDMDHGLMETHLPGGFLGYGHGGDTLWFHSNLVTVPQLRLGVFVTTNTQTGVRLTRELPELIVQRFYAPPQVSPLPGSPALASQRAVYAGAYLTNRRPFTGLEKAVFLVSGRTEVAVTPDGRLITPGANGAQAWVPVGPPGHFQAVDGPQTMDFALQGGRAARVYPGGPVSFDRVGPLYQLTVLLQIALLAAIAVLATLVGPVIRFSRQLPATSVQRVAGAMQLVTAGVWVVAFVAAAMFAAGAGNPAQIQLHWPGAPLVVCSTAALIAAIGSAVCVLDMPFVWAGRDGWGVWRKLRFSATSLIFAALGLQLAFWGLLEPWAK